MSKSTALLVHYQKWFEFALFEHRMIKEKKWDEINAYTGQKQKIMDAIQDIESNEVSGKEPQSEALRLLIHQLADLEQLNHSLLQERMGELKVQIDDSAQRMRVAQQIRNRYQERGEKSGDRVFRRA